MKRYILLPLPDDLDEGNIIDELTIIEELTKTEDVYLINEEELDKVEAILNELGWKRAVLIPIIWRLPFEIDK